MDKSDREDLHIIRNWFFGFVLFLVILGGAMAFIGQVYDLAWYPFKIQMQTGMIRNSNSYITTQQTALREFRTDYETADSEGQKNAILRQMHQIADLIPGQVQPDIDSFLQTH